jgi:mannose-6-phosphate isomerase-like protein (cupin superfamily)
MMATTTKRLQKISLAEQFDSFSETWTPKILARANDFALKAAKLDGEFVWHRHAEEDEIFLVLRGRIDMHYRTGDAEHVESFGAGELLQVPRGIEHKPVADPGTEILLIERSDTINTGDVEGGDRPS